MNIFHHEEWKLSSWSLQNVEPLELRLEEEAEGKTDILLGKGAQGKEVADGEPDGTGIPKFNIPLHGLLWIGNQMAQEVSTSFHKIEAQTFMLMKNSHFL